MSDEERRQAERTAAETGDRDDQVQALRARFRSGTLSAINLEFAAYVGDALARRTLEWPQGVPHLVAPKRFLPRQWTGRTWAIESPRGRGPVESWSRCPFPTWCAGSLDWGFDAMKRVAVALARAVFEGGYRTMPEYQHELERYTARQGGRTVMEALAVAEEVLVDPGRSHVARAWASAFPVSRALIPRVAQEVPDREGFPAWVAVPLGLLGTLRQDRPTSGASVWLMEAAISGRQTRERATCAPGAPSFILEGQDHEPDLYLARAIRDEVAPWALGLRDPVRERVEDRRRKGNEIW